LSKLGFDTTATIYAGALALLANLIVCFLATWILRAVKAPDGEDVTRTTEYFADRDDPRIHDLPDVGALK
jgi:SSS family solute:Na+ symporter